MQTPLRLSELVATMSFAGDTGMGMPDEAGLRGAILAVAIGEECGADEQSIDDAYWISLLRYAGCTADADLNAGVMIDEIAVHEDMYGVDYGNPAEMMPFMIRRIGNDLPLPRRVLAVLTAFARLPSVLDTGTSHCEVGDRLAAQFGLSTSTRTALFQVFERWDGKGLPKHVKGEAIALASRIAACAVEAEIGLRLGGVDGATAWVKKRRGNIVEPRIADAFLRRAGTICARVDVPSIWPALLAAERGGPRIVDDAQLDAALNAMADFADLKCKYTRGHSSSVAALAKGAAEAAHLTRAEAVLVERAALVHDIGRVGVSATIWDAPRALTDREWERVRLHPHVTERIFARVPPLASLGEIAGLAHERLDAKGYHRRLPSAALTPAARLLAAADAYAAMTEERPHRAALPAARAADELRREAREGKLDGECVEAVLGAAGHRMKARAPRPGALSDREVEVIRLIAHGKTNKEIAVALGISVKTAGNHVQHVFEKCGVSTRSSAAMYAMQHGLV